MKRRQVIYTADAATDLETIYDTVAEASDATIAARYDQRLRDF